MHFIYLQSNCPHVIGQNQQENCFEGNTYRHFFMCYDAASLNTLSLE